MRRWFWTMMGSVMALGASGAGATTLLGQPAASVSAGGQGQAEVAVEVDAAVPPAGTVESEIEGEGELDAEVVTGPTGGDVADPEPPEEPPASDRHRELRDRLRRCFAHHHVDVERLLAEHAPRELLRRCLAHHVCDRPGEQPSAADAGSDARCRPVGRPEDRPVGRPEDRPVDRPEDRPVDRPEDRPVGRPGDRPVGPPTTPGGGTGPSVPAPDADAEVSVGLSLEGGLSVG